MDLWFIVRKFISALLYPPNFFLLLAVLGIGMAWYASWRKKGLILTTVSLFCLLLLALPITTHPIVRHWEDRYPPLSTGELGETHPRWIVVLGSGSRMKSSPDEPGTAGLFALSQARTVEGIRLAKELPEAQLVFMGADSRGKFSGARAMADLAKELGIPKERILIVESPTSTWEEAKEARQMIGSERLILVTSAVHLPRAVFLFEEVGLDVLPAPTDFLVENQLNRSRAFSLSPMNWVIWQRFSHEIYGHLWSRWIIRGNR